MYLLKKVYLKNQMPFFNYQISKYLKITINWGEEIQGLHKTGTSINCVYYLSGKQLGNGYWEPSNI